MSVNLPLPLHVLVEKGANHHPSKDFVYHEWSGSLPKGAILDTDQGFFVSSPEFCFIQMASELSLIELIELGYELCGSYSIADEGLLQTIPLTTVSKLKKFTNKIQGVNGIKNANRALRYIINDSGSPMETKLTILLCLPCKLGGYGIPEPILNHRVDLDPLRRSSLHPSYYVCDLYWPEARLAIEYDSDKFHTGASRIAYDSMRRNRLTALGITVVTVTNSQIKSSFEIENIAKLVTKKTGKRIRHSKSDFLKSHANLREELGLSDLKIAR